MTSGISDSADFRGRVVLITGAATGIGRAVAVAFAKRGAKLSIGDVNEAAARETLELVKSAGAEVIFVRTDVSQEADVQRLVSETVERFDHLDCAFNKRGSRRRTESPSQNSTPLVSIARSPSTCEACSCA
jgi:NAD(P)-dependent dehydrogenase (short-subunit alcohol dehydrogenase family)